MKSLSLQNPQCNSLKLSSVAYQKVIPGLWSQEPFVLLANTTIICYLLDEPGTFLPSRRVNSCSDGSLAGSTGGWHELALQSKEWVNHIWKSGNRSHNSVHHTDRSRGRKSRSFNQAHKYFPWDTSIFLPIVTSMATVSIDDQILAGFCSIRSTNHPHHYTFVILIMSCNLWVSADKSSENQAGSCWPSWFFGLSLVVFSNVLQCRPDQAILVLLLKEKNMVHKSNSYSSKIYHQVLPHIFKFLSIYFPGKEKW